MVEGSLKLAGNKTRMRLRMPTHQIQRLYETCKEVFSDVQPGTVPSNEAVARLKTVLDNTSASDVCLTPILPYFWEIDPDEAPIISYLQIYECDKFTICVFCLPPSAVIPLHNHPGMTVFSKLLFGTMHVKSYDWFDSLQNTQEPNIPHFRPLRARLATVKTDEIFSAPCETSILYPASGGNMHRFTAMTPCAVLDVLGPPYSDPEGRHCTYYNEFPFPRFSLRFSGDTRLMVDGEKRKYAYLAERERPDEYFVLGAKYRGPQVQES